MADHELYESCRKSVVEIFHKPTADGDYCCSDTGVILFHESDFVYIVGCKTCTHGSNELDVVFQDGNSAVGDMVQSIGPFIGAGCFLPETIETTEFKAVQFHEEKLLQNDSVYTLTFKDSGEPPDLTPGFVSTSEELFFYHTCREASKFTKDGAPVFKQDGLFVGLCYDVVCGLFAASSVRSLAHYLSESYGANNMGINEILQHIYASAMQ